MLYVAKWAIGCFRDPRIRVLKVLESGDEESELVWIISAAVLCQWIAEHDTPPTDGEAEELAREIDRRLCEAWGEIFSLAVLEWRDGQ